MDKVRVNIGLEDPKSPDNVGSVLRAAANYRVEHVFYTGVRYSRALERRVRAMDMGRKVSRDLPISSTENLLDAAGEEMTIVCIELVENAIPLPAYQHPDNALYIFGPEDGSLSQEMIEQADDVVYIPTVGSMNLAATVNVVLYDRAAKSEQWIADNDLIRHSRDTNNRLKIS